MAIRDVKHGFAHFRNAAGNGPPSVQTTDGSTVEIGRCAVPDKFVGILEVSSICYESDGQYGAGTQKIVVRRDGPNATLIASLEGDSSSDVTDFKGAGSGTLAVFSASGAFIVATATGAVGHTFQWSVLGRWLNCLQYKA